MKSNEHVKKKRKGKTYSDGEVEACAPVGPRGVACQLVYPGQGRGNNNPVKEDIGDEKRIRCGDLINRFRLVRETIEKRKRGNKKLFGAG
jgi:hypothetical protein